ncbi:MFS transporter [Streptomyces sp. NPDC048202]|uniref:MFS transporter n=1 Tax=Streptomyces sp. NPDC048202 TaxID=3365514 RepID=UPI003722A5E8
MFGKRRILMGCLGLLVAGSLICASTSELVPMVAGRALQGGSMGVIPLGVGMMRDEVPAERVGSAMALMSACQGIGGAFVAEHADWHVLYLASAGFAAAALLLVRRCVPQSPVRCRPPRPPPPMASTP